MLTAIISVTVIVIVVCIVTLVLVLIVLVLGTHSVEPAAKGRERGAGGRHRPDRPRRQRGRHHKFV